MQIKDRLEDVPSTCKRRRDSFERAAVVDHIDRQLRQIYSGVVAEPMPAEFYYLLNALEGNSDRKRRASQLEFRNHPVSTAE